jgi:hypothetical protein
VQILASCSVLRPKPEARAEGMCVAAQHTASFPSACDSGLCGVLPQQHRWVSPVLTHPRTRPEGAD